MICIEGIAPVVIKPPASTNVSGTLPAMRLTLDLSTARAIITTHNMIRFLKSKVLKKETKCVHVYSACNFEFFWEFFNI